jgi:hypothetical protein
MKQTDSLYDGAVFIAEEVFLVLVCNLIPYIMVYLVTSWTDPSI